MSARHVLTRVTRDAEAKQHSLSPPVPTGTKIAEITGHHGVVTK
jgi:hypothetical protein